MEDNSMHIIKLEPHSKLEIWLAEIKKISIKRNSAGQ